MTLNEKANVLTENERDVLENIDVETGDFYSEAWIVENYTKTSGREFSGVCSALAKKGLIKPRSFFGKGEEYMIWLTREGMSYLSEESYKKHIDSFEDDELFRNNHEAWLKKHGFDKQGN